MSYFLYEGILALDQEYSLGNEEAHHILQARRLRKGDQFELQDSEGARFLVTLTQVARREFHFTVDSSLSTPPPSPLKLQLAQGLLKEKALHFVIQKATELGIESLLFFEAEHTAKQLSAAQQPTALTRWQKIAQEACKQSGRQFPPEIHYFPSLSHLLTDAPSASQQWSFLLSEESPHHAAWPPAFSGAAAGPHRVYIGPEGGWSASERETLTQQPVQTLTLGPRTLKAETAALTAISIFQFLGGDLGSSVYG